jgi:hypothetical protein
MEPHGLKMQGIIIEKMAAKFKTSPMVQILNLSKMEEIQLGYIQVT